MCLNLTVIKAFHGADTFFLLPQYFFLFLVLSLEFIVNILMLLDHCIGVHKLTLIVIA